MVTISPEPWPEDLAFQTLARKVRDGVMLVEHQGEKIAASRGVGCCCPLGAALRLQSTKRAASHPGASAFVHALVYGADLDLTVEAIPDEKMIWAFIAGFEAGMESKSDNYAVRAAGRLGLEYRRLAAAAARLSIRPKIGRAMRPAVKLTER